MIVALIALFVALGGTATATTLELITSAQIKNGTIQLVDISPRAKAALRGRPGPEGPPGVVGPSGGFDPNKIVYVVWTNDVRPARRGGERNRRLPDGDEGDRRRRP